MWISQNELPSLDYDLKKIVVKGTTINSSPPIYMHGYTYTYGIVMEDYDHRPRPIF